MFNRTKRIAVCLFSLLIVLLLSTSLAVAKKPVKPTPTPDSTPATAPFKIINYIDYNCTELPCPVYDFGTVFVPEVKTTYFTIQNTSGRLIRDFTVTFAGDDVPGIFAMVSNTCPTRIRELRICEVGLAFIPQPADPDGTVYGGDASLAVLTLEGSRVDTTTVVVTGTKASQ